MSLEVTVGEEYLGSVLGDLAQRRGSIRDIQSRHSNKVLLATVPLSEMMVSWLSTLSKGFLFTLLHLSFLNVLTIMSFSITPAVHRI